MAAVTLSVRSRDIYGRPKRTLIRFPGTVTLAQIQSYLTAYVPKQRAIQQVNIDAAEVTFELTVPSNALADTGIKAQDGARFSFANASLNRYGVWVPGIKTTLLVGEKDIDTAASIVTDWTALLTTGDGTIAPCNEAEQDLGALVSAIQSHNK